MSDRELPVSFGTFLIMGILPKLAEKGVFGKPSIRVGRVLALSGWLYEVGAILGRFWRDRIPVLVSMYEVGDKRAAFTEYWHSQASNRLHRYGERPEAFPTFVLQTDSDILMGKKLEDLLKIGDKKVSGDEANKWLRLAEASIIEGIMFGALYPDLTYTMLTNEYEKADMDSWKQARKFGVTLPEQPSQMSVAAKEKEAIEMARDYVTEYHPELSHDLGLLTI